MTRLGVTAGGSRLTLLAVALVALSGCGGSRLSHDDVVAAVNGQPDAGGAAAAAAPSGAATGSQGSGGAAGAPTTLGPAQAPAGSGASGGARAGGATPAAGARGSGAPSGAVAAADHSPIAIGNVSELSGPGGQAEAPGVQGVQVWAQWVNSRGGVNGHPIQLYVVNDNGDPAQEAAAVQDLYQNDHIVALVDNWASQSQQGSVNFINQNHIPVVGGDATASQGWGGSQAPSPMFFPQMDVENDILRGAIDHAAKLQIPKGNKVLGVMSCTESSICTQAENYITQYGPSKGFTVHTYSASFAAPNYTAQCLQAKSDGVQVLYVIQPSDAGKRTADDCAQQSFHPAYILGYGITDASFADDPAFNGANGTVPAFPFTGASTPAISEFQQAYHAFAPDTTIQPASAVGWAAAKMFELAVSRIQGPVTSQAILNALWTFQGETMGGLTIPLTFKANAIQEPPICWFDLAIDNGKFIAPNGAKYECE